MKLGHIELFVKDVLVARDFYVSVLGFRLIEIQADQFVWIEAGPISVLLRPGTGEQIRSSYADASSGLVLYTDDLERTAAELTARGLVFRGDDGSPKCLTFTDPDGHWFQLVNPRDH
jgi:catechol 2,3-dioxygenase-like lactoylglutathione lyase family enzyme